MNLGDRDLTGYLITQTLTLSRLHAHLEQAILYGACSERTSAIKLITHAQRADLEQTRGIRLFNYPSGANRKTLRSQRSGESMALANVRAQLASLIGSGETAASETSLTSCSWMTMLSTIGRTGVQRRTQLTLQLLNMDDGIRRMKMDSDCRYSSSTD